MKKKGVGAAQWKRRGAA